MGNCSARLQPGILVTMPGSIIQISQAPGKFPSILPGGGTGSLQLGVLGLGLL